MTSPARACGSLLIAGILAACSVARSVPVMDPTGLIENCDSKLGTYALPRRVLKIKVKKVKEDFVMEEISADPVADNDHVYCIDHKRNPFAHDTVRLFKNKIITKDMKHEIAKEENEATPERELTPFLQLIASRSIDHTAGIIRNLIRAVFIGISNNPDFHVARTSISFQKEPTVAEFQVDPFDHVEMANVNQGLRRFGFCLVLESYTFNRGTTAPSRYCDRPRRQMRAHVPPSSAAIQDMRWFVPKPQSGIFYRPRAPYQLAIYTKHFPDDPGPWTLGMLKTFEMENIMPVVSVGINRAIFATRRTGMIFEDGDLQNVCISKGSSISGAIEIPLDIVYGIIALPGETLRAMVTNTKARKDLLAARQQLIEAQKNYIAFLNAKEHKAFEPAPEKLQPLNLGTDTTPAPQGIANRPAPGGSPVPRDAGKLIDSNTDALNEICAQLTAAGQITNPINPDGPKEAF